MLTSRGWWFLVADLALLALGLFGGHAVLLLVALVLLLWFVGEWLLFALRSRVMVRRVTVRRVVSDGRTEVATLWAGQTFQVHVEVRLDGAVGLPHAAVADWLPFGLEHAAGSAQADGALRRGQPLRLAYEVRCPAAGWVRFEGVQLQLGDLQGFFFHTTFVADVVPYRVLPRPVDASGHPATTKRHNLLPPPGIHRLHRPGSGSELLDLRDYRPGDPPKTIAWKISARRDRLITKEFESEVPVRCTLFLDTSNSVRIGAAGQNALSGLVEIASAVAQANSANRDLTGLCLFGEETVRVVRPARGSRHLAKVLNLLVDAATLAPTAPNVPVEGLMQVAHPLAQEVYPQLMRPEVNRVPFWLPWIWPLPAPDGRPTSLRRAIYGVLFTFGALILLAAWVLLSYAIIDLIQEQLSPSWKTPPLLIDLSVLATLIAAIPLLRVAYHALPLLGSARRRRLARWRKRLAAVLALRYRLGPGGLAALLEDDEQMALWLQRFLAEHRVPYALPLYDASGRYLFACPGKVEVLARALVQAVGKGHDNELFVLLADLLELPHQLDPLLRAVRVALARHHQVVVVCPWPAGLPTPGAGLGEVGSMAEPQAALRRVATRRFQEAFQQLRRTFARMGVPVVWAAGGEAIPLILERMDRLRGLGRGRRR